MAVRQIGVGGGRHVGTGQPALVVAELGQNHNGRLDLAEQLIDAAAWAGADAVKLVKRDLDSELSREASDRPYLGPHAFGATYGEHRRALELPAEAHAALCRRARRHGLLFFCTACDVPSARLLESLAIDVFKIASRDLNNLPLLSYVAGRSRPLFLSTGMFRMDHIDAAVTEVRRQTDQFVLLQCTSLYPTPYEHAHLRSMATLAERYACPVGYSDHTPGTLLPAVAVALGAVVIEKHLTLDRTLKGTDHACSLQPDELRQVVADIRHVEQALGRPDKPLPDEVDLVRAKLGRSLVARTNLTAGTQLQEPMLTLKCPGDGLSWLDRQLVLGRRLKRNVDANEKLSVDDFES